MAGGTPEEMEMINDEVDGLDEERAESRFEEKYASFMKNIASGKYLEAYEIFREYPEVALQTHLLDLFYIYSAVSRVDRNKAELLRDYIQKQINEWQNDATLENLLREAGRRERRRFNT